MKVCANPYVDGDLADLAMVVARFAQDRVAPGYVERDSTRVLDRALAAEMGELGLIAPELPEPFGGQGATKVAAGVIRADRGRRPVLLLREPAGLNAQILATHGDPAVVGPWLHELTAGRVIAAPALTEPRGGSDAAGLQLQMERDGGHYVLTGEKTSISAADQADVAVVFGRTSDLGARGVTAVMVPLDAGGISTNRFDCHGQRAIVARDRVGRANVPA
jgi:cyclohexanecarboxyl-CoA dehydrogenase